MPPEPRPAPAASGALTQIARAAALGALLGAVVGAVEALCWLIGSAPRGSLRALNLLAIAVAGDALVGALLALPCALAARLLARPSEHRVAPAWACAGLGALTGTACWIGPPGPSLAVALACALGGTVLALALRELLAWWPRVWSARAWSLALACCLVACLTRIAMLPAGPRGAGADRTGDNVLLISLDTLRADHLGCYGAGDAWTPSIDRLAAEGVLFEDATAQANTTGPSHVTLLTGLLPAEHGARSNGVPLSKTAETLPEALAERGWQSAAFVSGFPLADDACGLGARFQHYDDDLLAPSWITPGCEGLRVVQLLERWGVNLGGRERRGGATVDRALAWLEQRSGDERPFFLFLHLYDAHGRYEAPAEHVQRHDPLALEEPAPDWYAMTADQRRELVLEPAAQARMRARYRAEISYADAQVGRVLEFLEQRQLLEHTLIVLTSDHGEGLGAHGYYFDHGTFLYDEELRVPLILRLPEGEHAGVRIPSQARSCDLAPTLLDLLGLNGALKASGTSLLPRMDGVAGAADSGTSFAIAEFPGDSPGWNGVRISARRGLRKLIWTDERWLDTTRAPPTLEAYDLSSDPGEQQDLGPAFNAQFDELRDELGAFRAKLEALEEVDAPDAQVLERLRGLGYQ